LKIALDSPIKDLSDEPIRDGETVFTIAKAATNALLTLDQKDGEVSGSEKARRFKLAMQIHAGGNQDLSVDDVSTIKKLIGRLYPPLVVGRAYEILDPGAD
jgi:hypothetical protein